MSPRTNLLVIIVLAFVLAVFARKSVGGGGGGGGAVHAQWSREAAEGGLAFDGGGGGRAVGMAAMAAAPAMAPAPPTMMMADASFEEGGGSARMHSSKMMAGSASEGVSSAVEQMGRVELAPPDAGVLTGPVILKSGSSSLETKDVAASMKAVEARCVAGLGGYVENSFASTDEWLLSRWREALGPRADPALVPAGPTNGHLQLRVPSDRFADARAAVREEAARVGGRVSSEQESGSDATETYADVVTRARIDEKALKQMEALLGAATTVHEILSVKREMDAIAARTESHKAQRKSLEGRARMSAFTVSFSLPQPPAPAPPPPPPGWSVGATFQDAVAALGKTGQAAAEVLIFTLVFMPVVAVVGFLAVFGARRAAGVLGAVGGGGGGGGAASSLLR
jgi:hypothetical protein